MRTGKAYIRGHSYSRSQLPKSINSKTLLTYRKKQMSPATHAAKLQYTKIIRDALGTYIGVIKASKNPRQNVVITLKEQKQEIHKVMKATRRLLNASNEKQKQQWKHRVLCLLGGNQNDGQFPSISLNTRDFLHRRLRRFGGNLIQLVSYLHGDSDYPPATIMLKVLAADETALGTMLEAHYGNHSYPDALAIVTRSTRIKKSKFHDQFLFELVRTLTPIWKEATGRSPWPRSVDATGDEKAYDFWQWLCSLIKEAGGNPPAYGSVRGIVSHLKLPE